MKDHACVLFNLKLSPKTRKIGSLIRRRPIDLNLGANPRVTTADRQNIINIHVYIFTYERDRERDRARENLSI